MSQLSANYLAPEMSLAPAACIYTSPARVLQRRGEHFVMYSRDARPVCTLACALDVYKRIPCHLPQHTWSNRTLFLALSLVYAPYLAPILKLALKMYFWRFFWRHSGSLTPLGMGTCRSMKVNIKCPGVEMDLSYSAPFIVHAPFLCVVHDRPGRSRRG